MNSEALNILYTDAFNAIDLARKRQISITQKEIEIQMIDLNRGYLSYKNICLENEKKFSIEVEIKYLRETRDYYLNKAISNALILVENEMQEKQVFSTVTIVLNSIISLLVVVKNSFKVSFTNRSNLSLISSRLIYADSSMFQLRNSIEELKKNCGVI